MQDVQTTNLNLARRETYVSCSWNHSISSGSALELTVAAGTNEVAMWALQLYIGFFPNFHSPFREPTTSIFRTVFSHGINIPPPTSWLSLGHFSSRAPGAPFFHIMARYARALSHLSNTCSYLLFSSDIVHFGYLVVLCAGTWSSSLRIIPSGIYSALACSLSRCIAFTFPVTPSDIGL
jgi:hypothetical protein